MEPRALTRGVAIAILVLAMGAAGVWYQQRAPAASGERLVKPLVPAGTRIRVEVLNASTVRGLARQATMHLRDLGFDVVKFSGDGTRRDTSLVIDRTGHPAWARLASEALGGAPVESRPDSAGFVDLTILVGATWRPPAQSLHP